MCFWPSEIASANTPSALATAALSVSFSCRCTRAGRSCDENQVYKLTYEKPIETRAVMAYTATSRARRSCVKPINQATSTSEPWIPTDASRENQTDRYNAMPRYVVNHDTID